MVSKDTPGVSEVRVPPRVRTETHAEQGRMDFLTIVRCQFRLTRVSEIAQTS